jgi:hypothetical protein
MRGAINSQAMTHEGRTLRMLVLMGEWTRKCLAIRVARRLGSNEVIETLADVMLWRRIPENIRSDKRRRVPGTGNDRRPTFRLHRSRTLSHDSGLH